MSIIKSDENWNVYQYGIPQFQIVGMMLIELIYTKHSTLYVFHVLYFKNQLLLLQLIYITISLKAFF